MTYHGDPMDDPDSGAHPERAASTSAPVACPECGSTSWRQWISYSGTELVELGWNEGGYTSETSGRKYDEDGDGWECENGHPIDGNDELSEQLDTARSEA